MTEIAIYGELIGPSIQKNYEYGLEEHELRIFDVSVNGHYLNWDDLVKLCVEYNLPLVEQVYRGPWNLELIKLAEAVDEYGGKKYTREGVVIKPVKERKAKLGRVVLKFISEKFRLNKENTGWH